MALAQERFSIFIQAKVATMICAAPHYLLLSESQFLSEYPEAGGQWRFVLRHIDGHDELDVSEIESDFGGDRLDLLPVVLGLEALDQPSRVTLITSSDYVTRGIRQGLAEWRENDWKWEKFGEMIPISNIDLWQRIDRALDYHEIRCRIWRLTEPAAERQSQSSQAHDGESALITAPSTDRQTIAGKETGVASGSGMPWIPQFVGKLSRAIAVL